MCPQKGHTLWSYKKSRLKNGKIWEILIKIKVELKKLSFASIFWLEIQVSVQNIFKQDHLSSLALALDPYILQQWQPRARGTTGFGSSPRHGYFHWQLNKDLLWSHIMDVRMLALCSTDVFVPGIQWQGDSGPPVRDSRWRRVQSWQDPGAGGSREACPQGSGWGPGSCGWDPCRRHEGNSGLMSGTSPWRRVPGKQCEFSKRREGREEAWEEWAWRCRAWVEGG